MRTSSISINHAECTGEYFSTIWHLGQFGIRTIWHRNVKEDNLAPWTNFHFGQFGTRTSWHRNVKEDNLATNVNLAPRTIWHLGRFGTLDNLAPRPIWQKDNLALLGWQIYIFWNALQCQIVPFSLWCQIVPFYTAVPNCPRCQIVLHPGGYYDIGKSGRN